MNGKELKALRERLGYKTQQALAKYLQVAPSTVSRWEHNIHPIPLHIEKHLSLKAGLIQWESSYASLVSETVLSVSDQSYDLEHLKRPGFQAPVLVTYIKPETLKKSTKLMIPLNMNDLRCQHFEFQKRVFTCYFHHGHLLMTYDQLDTALGAIDVGHHTKDVLRNLQMGSACFLVSDNGSYRSVWNLLALNEIQAVSESSSLDGAEEFSALASILHLLKEGRPMDNPHVKAIVPHKVQLRRDRILIKNLIDQAIKQNQELSKLAQVIMGSVQMNAERIERLYRSNQAMQALVSQSENIKQEAESFFTEFASTLQTASEAFGSKIEQFNEFYWSLLCKKKK